VGLGGALGTREGGTAGWRRQSQPSALRLRSGPASACRSTGQDQMFLGFALAALGEQEGGIALLEEAATALGTAFEDLRCDGGDLGLEASEGLCHRVDGGLVAPLAAPGSGSSRVPGQLLA